jgi:hypothetical protein
MEADSVSKEGQLQGCQVNYSVFDDMLVAAQAAGCVSADIAAQVRHGFMHGFSMGVQMDKLHGRVQVGNYSSALDYKDEVAAELRKRILKGKTVGPLAWNGVDDLPFAVARVNALGSVEYKWERWRRRCIEDASAPAGEAVNDACVGPAHTITAAVDVDDWVTPSCWITKDDLEMAFPIMPVERKEIPFLLVAFHDVHGNLEDASDACLYAHLCANFGPRPWPYHLHVLVTALVGIFRHQGIVGVAHFVDDLPKVTSQVTHPHLRCDQLELAARAEQRQLEGILKRCGMPDKKIKRECFQRGDVLGYIYDTVAFTKSLPVEKHVRCLVLVILALRGRSLTLAARQQLYGVLQHAAGVMPFEMKSLLQPGYAATAGLNRKHHKARVVGRERRCLQLWLGTLAQHAGCRSLVQRRFRWRTPYVYTDARGGASSSGAYWWVHGWRWWVNERRIRRGSSTLQEVQAVWQMCADLFPGVRGCTVPLFCDNQAVVEAIRARRAHSLVVNDFVHGIIALCSMHDVQLEVRYIRSKQNVLADALTRGDWRRFYCNLDDWRVAHS